VALDPVAADETRAIERAIGKLRAGGSTNAEAGLTLGYDLADEMFDRDMVNRVVLISDGVANVGETGPEGILERIGDRARDGIDLVTIGVGIDTYNDVLLEQLADQGDGWYAYVDSRAEAERLFRDNLTTSLQAVARDVKVQVEFDDDLVEEYRLLGFENRELDEDDFRNDRVDAGDINAGHSVTALYEVVLTRDAYRTDDPFATVRLRWADAETGDVVEIDGDVSSRVLASRFSRTNEHFQLAATVAAYAEVLRDSRYVVADLEDVLDEAEAIELRTDEFEEFVELVRRAVRLER
jgi:Ca-activated chloride channel family protein